MGEIELLLRGIPGRTDEGYLGQSSVVLVDGETLIDTGSTARRPMLVDALEEAGTEPGEVRRVLLTHLHFDHCENLDLFPAATVYVYDPELARVAAGEFDWATHRYVEAALGDRDVVRFTEGTVVDGIEAIHTPGHVEHHVSFLLEAGPTCGVTGDAIKNVGEFVSRSPFTFYDDAVARETIEKLAERLDFVIPGHDVPFYVTDGDAEPCGDVDLSVCLRLGGDAETLVRVESDRTGLRELPDSVRVIGPKLSFD